ncbi:MAG: arginine--tRNA ligase [Chloroflexi bacterium]|nr:MAG: arginine--tRNA ligase [Chloroflexota bacterium]TMF95128.1 MAG: arginine--tRNA ligase [Chloroflexota bacterium]
MVRDAIHRALVDAVRGLGVDGELPDLELGRAKVPAHGDYASSAGMKLARVLRRRPDEIAGELSSKIVAPDGAFTAEAAGGYVNFRLTDDWLRRLVADVHPGYGARDLGHGERLQVEFGSINPTGPLHIGHGRGVTLGDSIARLLVFTGHSVHREYYVNSDNTQTRRFGASVYARLHDMEPPEGGYLGDYVKEVAEMARRDLPGIDREPEEVAEPRLRRYAMEKVIEQIRASVARLGVRYDEWFWEDSIWQSGLGKQAIDRLRESGHLRERDGALWFGEPDDEGEEEQRVVIRANGQPTYFASDLGYLLSRFEQRTFNRVIEVWAADHHGYVPRMKAAAAALGLDPEKLVIIIHQLVNLKEGAPRSGQKVKMSKRAGRFVTLDELIDRVGSDAVRYFYLLRSPDTTIEFDLELAVTQGNENPVYYAQYAHARLANVESAARERHANLPASADVSLLTQPWELDVARQLAFWPDVVEDSTRLLEPHRIPYYVHDLATSVHRFYHAGNAQSEHRVVVDDVTLTRARLELCRAARHTLKTALDLMGVSAPERM